MRPLRVASACTAAAALFASPGGAQELVSSHSVPISGEGIYVEQTDTLFLAGGGAVLGACTNSFSCTVARVTSDWAASESFTFDLTSSGAHWDGPWFGSRPSSPWVGNWVDQGRSVALVVTPQGNVHLVAVTPWGIADAEVDFGQKTARVRTLDPSDSLMIYQTLLTSVDHTALVAIRVDARNGAVDALLYSGDVAPTPPVALAADLGGLGSRERMRALHRLRGVLSYHVPELGTLVMARGVGRRALTLDRFSAAGRTTSSVTMTRGVPDGPVRFAPCGIHAICMAADSGRSLLFAKVDAASLTTLQAVLVPGLKGGSVDNLAMTPDGGAIVTARPGRVKGYSTTNPVSQRTAYRASAWKQGDVLTFGISSDGSPIWTSRLRGEVSVGLQAMSLLRIDLVAADSRILVVRPLGDGRRAWLAASFVDSRSGTPSGDVRLCTVSLRCLLGAATGGSTASTAILITGAFPSDPPGRSLELVAFEVHALDLSRPATTLKRKEALLELSRKDQ